MKNIWKPTNLPAVTAAMGGSAMVLRRLVYVLAVDGKGLLVSGHPLVTALWLLTAAALGYIAVVVWKLDGSPAYADNFSAGKAALMGHAAAAMGIGITVLTNDPRMPGYLGRGWLVFGSAAPVCLALAGIQRYRGKRPFFLLHLIPCVFLLIHIVNHYQMWSADPQLLDYVFMLMGTIALMLFAFYTTAFDAGMGRRRMHLTMGLGAAYLLLVELAAGMYPWLYLGSIAWALTGLCTLEPKPKPEPETEEEK